MNLCSWRRMLVGALSGVSLLALLLGCGGGNKTATVTGKVTYKNNPVTGGYIEFVAPDGKGGGGSIQADGSYTATEVPYGQVKVVVTPLSTMYAPKPPPGKEASGSGREGPQPRPMFLPQKYSSKDTTTLSENITSGSQTVNINLTD